MLDVVRILHFEALNSNFHVCDHLKSVWMSFVIVLWSSLDHISRYRIVSLAKRWRGDWILLSMSLIKSRHKSGPKTEPCGTPDTTGVLEDFTP